MTNSYKKDFIGEEDIAFDTDRNNGTFERETSTGQFHTITKINATHIPVTDELTAGDAESVQDFLAVLLGGVNEALDFIETAGNWDSYLGEFATPVELISANPDPVDDAFAIVTSTQSFWIWDASLLTPEWIDLYRGYPTERVVIFPAANQVIDWEAGSVFDLGNIIQDVFLTFENVRQGQEITFNFTTTGTFTVQFPVSVLALDGGFVFFNRFNSITIKSVNGAEGQEALFHTDAGTGGGGSGGGIIPTIEIPIVDADHVVTAIDVFAGRIKMVGTTVVRTVTLDPAFVSSLIPFSVKNDGVTSGAIVRILVSNISTMTIDGLYVDLFLSPGELVTFEGDTGVNISVIARP